MAEGLNRISSRITQQKSQGGSQAMLFATGLREEDMSKAQIGICANWYEGNPCNMHLNILAGEVKKEVGENWHENERARAIFVAAVADHVANVNKKDEPYRNDPSRTETEEMIVGRTISRFFRRK